MKTLAFFLFTVGLYGQAHYVAPASAACLASDANHVLIPCATPTGPFLLTGQTGTPPATAPSVGNVQIFFPTAGGISGEDSSGVVYAMPSATILNAPANTFWGGPTSGANAAGGYRHITTADLPTILPMLTGPLSIDYGSGSATFLQLGLNSPNGVAAPVRISMGGTYGTNTPGSNANQKYSLFDDGAGTQYGIGMSANLMEFQAASAGSHGFFIGGALIAMIGANGPRTPPVTFATLTACVSGLEGTSRPITDSSTATFNATITGGGTNHIIAYCNGTNWTVH